MGMTSPGRGVVRVVRATVLTGLVILLTAAAHRLGGMHRAKACFERALQIV